MDSEKSTEKVKFSVMVSPDLLARIDNASQKAMQPRSEFVRNLLENAFPPARSAEDKRAGELAAYGNILTDKRCDCGLRMYEDNRTVSPTAKPNRFPGYWCKMCDSGLLDM